MTAAQPSSITFAGKNAILPNARQYPEARGKANGYLCPLGPLPGRGYVLLLKADLDAIADLNAPQSLAIVAGETIEFPALYILSAHQVSGGEAGDQNSAYLVKLTDKRHQLANFTAINKQYNVRAPAPPATSGASLYYRDSLTAGPGAIYSWEDLVEDIWDQLPEDLAGDVPTLPYDPFGSPDIPEGFRFIGVSAWHALHVVLEKIGCTTAYDPVADTFSFVQLGTEQAGLADILADVSGYLDDASPIPVVESTAYPETIRVFFHRLEKHFGTERETDRAGGSWSQFPAYAVDIPTTIEGAIEDSVLALWDDMPAVTPFISGTPNNTSDLTARAQQRADQWVAEAGVDLYRRVFQGILANVRTGSQVTGVYWRSTGGGVMTEVVRKPGIPRSVSASGDGLECSYSLAENIAPPDYARRTFPVYPRSLQYVEVTGTTRNADGLYVGRVDRHDSELLADHGAGEACYIKSINGQPLAPGHHLGKLNGSHSTGGVVRPLYLVKRGVGIAKATQNWSDVSDTVVCNPVVDTTVSPYVAPTVDTAVIIEIALLRKNRGTGLQDPCGTPNVVTGQMIAYETLDSGFHYCVSDYMDDPVGTIKMFAKEVGFGATDRIPQGWAVMDGSANSVLNGGSGIDMTAMFPRGHATTPGTAGGSDTHTHTAHTITDHPATGMTTNGPSTTTVVQSGTGVTVAGFTHGHTVDTPVLAHTISGHSTVNNIPAYKTVVFIERLDNSL